MAYLSDNLPSFAVVVGEEGDVVNGRSLPQSNVSIADKKLIAFDNIFKQIVSGIHVLKHRRVEDFDEAVCWRRAKEFETRIKRQNFELKQKIHLFKSKGAQIDSMHCNQALRIGRSILTSYIHYLPLSSNKLAPDGILNTLDLLCSLFEKFNCGKSLIESIEGIRSMLLSTGLDIPKNNETKKLIADLAHLKFGKKAPPIKNVKINSTLQKRIQRSHSLRYGNLPNKAPQSVAIKKDIESAKSPPAPTFPTLQSSHSSDDASVKNLLSRLADLESGIENIMAVSCSNSLSHYLAPSAVTHSDLCEKEETPVDITDDSLKEIQSYWAPATQVSEFIQVELCINRILDSVLLELSEEMASPTLIFDILKRELL